MRFSESVSEAITQAFALLSSSDLSDDAVAGLAEAVAQFLGGAGLETSLMSVCEAKAIKRESCVFFFFFFFLSFFLCSDCGSSLRSWSDCADARCSEKQLEQRGNLV
jgi:hypothetical protein